MAAPKIKPVKVGDKTRYRWVVDIGNDPKTGKRKQLTRTWDGLRQAEKELNKVLGKVDAGTFAMPSKTTVNEWLDQWLREKTLEAEENTKVNYANALKPVREMFGTKRLQKLTAVDVANLKEHMLTQGRKRGGKPGTGLSPRSVQLTLSRLRSALDLAAKRQMVPWNVATSVDPPKSVKTARVPWSPEEVKAFLASLSGHRLQAAMLLALIGMRPAEVCGLRWSDVDLDAETIAVGDNTRTIVWGEDGGRVEEKGAKSEAGKRKLPLPAPVATALLSFQTQQADEKLVAGAGYTDSGYVLVDELGEPRRTDWLRRRTYELMAAAKVRKVRLYDARHACLTYLRMSGVPGPIVSAWAGHADLTIADRVYVHPSEKDLEQGRDALAKLLG